MANAKRLCSYCDRYFPRGEMIISPKNQAFCCVDHQIKYALEAGAKLRHSQVQKKRKQSKAAVRQLRANDRKNQIYRTQQKFNELVRLLDKDKPCICCGRATVGKSVDCGHFLSRGSHPELRFNFLNAYVQLSSCNRGITKHTSGAKAASTRKGMETNIAARMGSEALKWLLGPHEVVKWTIDELKEMRSIFSAEIRHIEKHGEPSRNWRSLDYDLRDLIKEQGRRAA